MLGIGIWGRLTGIHVLTLTLTAMLADALNAQVPAPPDSRVYVDYRAERDFTFLRRGERELQADLFLPKTEGLRPAVLLVHGGGWMSGNKSRMFFHGRYLATRGYVALAIDYRLAPEHKYPAQIEDCREGVRWLYEHAEEYRIDTRRIAAYGYSAGGHLACLLGTTSPQETGERTTAENPLAEGSRRANGLPDRHAAEGRVRAVVAGGAPCDLMTYPEEDRGLLFFLGQGRSEAEALYRRASPITAVSADDAPTFFYHGDSDALVPLDNSRRMAERLKAVGVRSEHAVVHGRNHVGAFASRDVTADAVDFLDKVLGWSVPIAAVDGSRDEELSP